MARDCVLSLLHPHHDAAEVDFPHAGFGLRHFDGRRKEVELAAAVGGVGLGEDEGGVAQGGEVLQGAVRSAGDAGGKSLDGARRAVGEDLQDTAAHGIAERGVDEVLIGTR